MNVKTVARQIETDLLDLKINARQNKGRFANTVSVFTYGNVKQIEAVKEVAAKYGISTRNSATVSVGATGIIILEVK